MICAEDDLTLQLISPSHFEGEFSAFATERSGYDAEVTRRGKVTKALHEMQIVEEPEMIRRSIHRLSYFALSKISGEAQYHQAMVV